MKFQRWFTLSIAALAASFVFASFLNADVIQLQSGNGVIGGSDSQINFLAGPLNAGFGGPFIGTDFAAASSGPSAFVVNPVVTPGDPNATWIASLPSNPLAKWISTSSNSLNGGSGLFAISFNVVNPFTTASIDLKYASDDKVGDSLNAAFFLNGKAISNVGAVGGFTAENSFSSNNIAQFLNQGTNTLQVYLQDSGANSGIIFSAVVTAVPEPSSLLLLSGVVVCGFGFRRFRFSKSGRISL